MGMVTTVFYIYVDTVSLTEDLGCIAYIVRYL